MPSSFYRTKVFLFHRKLRSYETKTLREDRTAAEKNMPLMGSAAGGESCGAGFYFNIYCFCIHEISPDRRKKACMTRSLPT